MKNILYLVAIGVVIWVVKVSVFSTDPKEKETRDRLFQGLKITGQAIGDIIRSERARTNSGEYDALMDKLDGDITSMKQDKAVSSEYGQQLAELERKRKDLEEKLADYKALEEKLAATQRSQDEIGKNKKKSAPAGTAQVTDTNLKQASNEINQELLQIKELMDKMQSAGSK